ncbi:MAG: hypothetical protein LBE56_08015 [Tannerella sp.]|nr:hypothetical protein [Tannerella sp.]
MLILKPGETWQELGKQPENKQIFLTQYLFPLMGAIALAAFLGVFVTTKEFDIEIALKVTIRTAIAVTGGFYLAAYLLNEARKGIFNQQKNMDLCRFFVGYASAMMYVLYIVTSLLPDFFFLKIFGLYTVYMIWEGAGSYMRMNEGTRMKFTVIASCIVILTPFVIEHALRMLMPGFRV